MCLVSQLPPEIALGWDPRRTLGVASLLVTWGNICKRVAPEAPGTELLPRFQLSGMPRPMPLLRDPGLASFAMHSSCSGDGVPVLPRRIPPLGGIPLF